MFLKVDCLPNAVGKQPSIPLIILGRKWTLSRWWLQMNEANQCIINFNFYIFRQNKWNSLLFKLSWELWTRHQIVQRTIRWVDNVFCLKSRRLWVDSGDEVDLGFVESGLILNTRQLWITFSVVWLLSLAVATIIETSTNCNNLNGPMLVCEVVEQARRDCGWEIEVFVWKPFLTNFRLVVFYCIPSKSSEVGGTIEPAAHSAPKCDVSL